MRFYGPKNGDVVPDITSVEQQRLTVETIMKNLAENNELKSTNINRQINEIRKRSHFKEGYDRFFDYKKSK